MKLEQENAQVTCSFNNFLNKGLLLLEVQLKLQYVLIAAVHNIGITFTFALAMTVWSMKTSFFKNSFDVFGFIWVFQMVIAEDHHLWDFHAISDAPSVMHSSLLASWLDIHS